jgi:hypothetical protein
LGKRVVDACPEVFERVEECAIEVEDEEVHPGG